MNTQDPKPAANESHWQRVEALIRRFEAEWMSDNPPDLPTWWRTERDRFEWPSEATAESETAALLELVAVDMEFQWKRGISQHAESYLKALSEFGVGEYRYELLVAETEARHVAGNPLAEDEVIQRFPDLVEAWRNRVGISMVARESVPAADMSAEDKAFQTMQPPASDSTIQRIATLTLRPGDRFERFELLERLGEGAFSVVWRARDLTLDRDVAVKLIRPEMARRDPRIVARMRREARAVAAIEHRGIAHVYDVGESMGLTFISQQFIAGPTLEKKLTQTPVEITRAAEIARDLAYAVHAAHECGVVHRDLKPANILMDRGEYPVVVDFGLALMGPQRDHSLTRQGELVGTPVYMSPQQALGDHHLVDSRADIYSIGVILFQMLEHRIPFSGGAMSVLNDVVYKPSGRIFRFERKSIPKDLKTIVAKCVEKEPSERYRSAEALAQDLERFIAGQPILARPVSMAEALWRWTRRNPRAAAVVALILILTAGVVGAVLQLDRVNRARVRAEAAEQRVGDLLQQSSMSAGLMAMERGRFRDSIDHLDQAREIGLAATPAWSLSLAESLLAVGDLDRCKTVLDEIDLNAATAEEQTQCQLLTAQWLHRTGADPTNVSRSYRNVLAMVPDEGQEKFVQAVLAKSTPQAIELLRESLVAAPLELVPRKTLALLHFSLADFEATRGQLAIARQLFPEDDDFLMLEAWLAAVDGDLKRMDALIASSRQGEANQALWQKAGRAIHEIRTTYSHQEGMATDFNEGQLASLARRYLEAIHPCLLERGFIFPLALTGEFKAFADSLRKFVDSPDRIDDVRNALSRVVEIHPEPSLLVLRAGMCIATNELDTAAELIQRALDRTGFVSGTAEMSADAYFVLLAARMAKGTLERDADSIKTLVEAVDRLEKYPELVQLYSTDTMRGSTVVSQLVEALKMGEVGDRRIEKWLKRLEERGTVNEIETTWIRAIVNMYMNRNVIAIEYARRLQALDPQGEAIPSDAVQGLVTTCQQRIAEMNPANHAEDEKR